MFSFKNFTSFKLFIFYLAKFNNLLGDAVNAVPMQIVYNDDLKRFNKRRNSVFTRNSWSLATFLANWPFYLSEPTIRRSSYPYDIYANMFRSNKGIIRDF